MAINMRYRQLGRTGLNVSEIGFGAWAIGGGWGPQDEQTSIEALNRAYQVEEGRPWWRTRLTAIALSWLSCQV